MEEERWPIPVPLAQLQLLTLMNTTSEKQTAYQAAWRAANPEKVKAHRAAYYAANAGKVKAYKAAWRAANAEKIKASAAAYRAANPDRDKAYSAAYYAANRDKRAAYAAAWRAANREKRAAYYAANSEREKARKVAYFAANRDRVKAYSAAYFKKNSKKVYARRLNRYRTNPNVRIAATIRGHLRRIVKSGGVKDAASISYVGCTVAQLRKHIERQFAPGMTWENHGSWHIDHIVPLAAFDFAAFPAQIKQAEHYTNLRPMWAAENISKCDTLPHPVQLELIAV